MWRHPSPGERSNGSRQRLPGQGGSEGRGDEGGRLSRVDEVGGCRARPGGGSAGEATSRPGPHDDDGDRADRDRDSVPGEGTTEEGIDRAAIILIARSTGRSLLSPRGS
jgi:hypothetical protein